MTITELRKELAQVRDFVLHSDQESAVRTLDRTLQKLDSEQLLTTTEAASLLGIRSVNTLKRLLRMEGVSTVQHGNRTMVPLGEIERLQWSDRVRGLQTADRLHDTSASLGEAPLSQETLGDIAAARPGTLPWERRDRP